MYIPLFPLDTVVFPGGSLQLRIFEPRYLDLVSRCLREDTGFGICLVAGKGDEAVDGTTSQFRLHATGTHVRIIDWEGLEHNLLGIRVEADRRFRVHSVSQRKDRLVEGEVDWRDENVQALSKDHASFAQLLQEIVQRFQLDLPNDSACYNEALWVSGRLAEILPFNMLSKQHMLEMDDPRSRFDYMQGLLENMDLEKYSLQ